MRTTAQLINLFTDLSLNQSGQNQNTAIKLLSEQQRLLIERYFDNERQFSTETVGAMNLTFASEPALGDTSATLSSAWNYASGVQQIYPISTVDSNYLITTAVLASGATSGTLTKAWKYPTGTYTLQFPNSNLDQRQCSFTNNSTSFTWSDALTGATTSTQLKLLQVSDTPQAQFTNGSDKITWQEPLNSQVTQLEFSTAGFEKYRIPTSISKITNCTITVGTLRFVPKPIQTRTEWDNINFLPYPSDIPVYFFIYGGYCEFWPVPSTTGNRITFNYKSRVPDFNLAFTFAQNGSQYVNGSTPTVYDYTQGTITSASVDGVSITGSGTNWTTAQGTTGTYGLGMVANSNVTPYNLGLMIDPPYGDGLWYPIQTFDSDTMLTLASPIQNAPNISNATYSIGQMPVLQEDFGDTIVYGALMMYFSTVSIDPNKYKQFEIEYNKRIDMLEEYAGTKQVNYNLGERPELLNPNNYTFYPTNVSA